MAYEPTVWESGDIVTSAKLNKLEQGVASAAGGGGGGGGGALVVTGTIVDDPGGGQRLVCDKTTGQIINAIQTGGAVFSLEMGGMLELASFTHVTFDGEIYDLHAGTGDSMITFHASSLDDYPDASIGG